MVKTIQKTYKLSSLIKNMGITLLKIKIMPISPEENLEKIKEEAQKIVEKNEGKKCRFEEEPIAFGLKAVILFFEIDESQELEIIEEELNEIKNVNSVKVEDMRRAFG
jgi:elongation factor 1-beta